MKRGTDIAYVQGVHDGRNDAYTFCCRLVRVIARDYSDDSAELAVLHIVQERLRGLWEAELKGQGAG